MPPYKPEKNKLRKLVNKMSCIVERQGMDFRSIFSRSRKHRIRPRTLLIKQEQSQIMTAKLGSFFIKQDCAAYEKETRTSLRTQYSRARLYAGNNRNQKALIAAILLEICKYG